MRFLPCLFLAVLGFFTSAAVAEVSCPIIFGNHMVLQRDRPVAVWGTAAPGEKVSVLFAGQTKKTTTSPEGAWRINLDPMPASRDPRTLTVRGDNAVNFSDVLVGEVWFCSGQSNMEKQLGPRPGQKPTDNYEAEIKQADLPLLRLFQVPHYGKPSDKITGLQWLACTPETVASTQFSATGYYFGREIQQDLDVPVGLINSSYGGTRIEAWLPPSAFERPELRGLPGGPDDSSFKDVGATKLYNTMVAPFVPFSLRGFLWYQGESNLMSGDTSVYSVKLLALIESWRSAWGQPEAPFNYVLIAPFHYSKRSKDRARLTEEGLPLFWQAQIATLTVSHTGIVSTTDITGNVKDIHPTNKRDVGLRLARVALADTYGRRNLVAHSPRYDSMAVSSGGIILTFNNTGSGLASRDGNPLDCFLIAGEDQRFVPAQAVVEKGKIVVSSPDIQKPVAVRYAWNETANPNLINSAGLPALPFRTDNWAVTVERPLPPPEPEAPAPTTAPAEPTTTSKPAS